MILRTAKDVAAVLLDTADFLVNGKHPASYTARVKLAPEYFRIRHIMMWLNRIDLDPAEREQFEKILAGEDVIENLPTCETCKTTFDPCFRSRDGVRASKTKCVGCVRAEKETLCTT